MFLSQRAQEKGSLRISQAWLQLVSTWYRVQGPMLLLHGAGKGLFRGFQMQQPLRSPPQIPAEGQLAYVAPYRRGGVLEKGLRGPPLPQDSFFQEHWGTVLCSAF